MGSHFWIEIWSDVDAVLDNAQLLLAGGLLANAEILEDT